MKYLLLIILSSSSAWGIFENFSAFRSYKQGDFEKSCAYLDAVILDNPQNYEAIYNRGKASFANNDYNAAKAYFNNATQAPEKGLKEKAYYDLGNAQVKLNELQEALKSFEEVLSLNPKNEYAKKMIEEIKKRLQQQKEEKKEDKQDQKKDENQDDKNQSGNSGNQKNQNNEQNSQDNMNNDQAQSDSSEQKSDSKSKENKPQNSNKESQPQEKKPSEHEQPSKSEKSSPKKPREDKQDAGKKGNQKQQASNAKASVNNEKLEEEQALKELEDAAQGDKQTLELLKALDKVEKNNAKKSLIHSLKGIPRTYGHKNW